MKSLPSIWFALILLTMLAFLTFWIDRIVQPPQPKRDGSTRHDPDYIVKNFSSVKSDVHGDPRYSLSGMEMRHYPDDDTTELEKPSFAMYSLRKPTVQVSGDQGYISANGENVYFMDNVRVVRAATPQKGELTLLTEYLHVIPDQDMLKTDREVTILQAPRTVVHAVGMELYKKERILKLLNRVRVHYERTGIPAGLPPALKKQAKDDKKLPVSVHASQKPAASSGMAGSTGTPTTKKATSSNLKLKKSPAPKKSNESTQKNKSRIRRHYGNPAN